jgi:ATP-binding cassette, subfamily B, bacterial
VSGRILRLFLPHRAKLAGLLVLVTAQSAASVASPFLLRGIVDHALPDRDDRLLTILTAGIVAASLASGALGVATTWLSNTIGQEIMHDLRTSLYEHVQRMSLAFFTRTRAGELQSRIANDIGAIDNVVTSAAGTIVSSGTTMLAVIAALFALDWKLACFSVAVVPLLAWLNRRTGRTRRRISGRRQTQLADLTSLVNESLSVSGFLLARTMGRTDELNRRFRDESRRIRELEVEASMAGRWRVATVSMAFTILPACIYWLAGMTGTVTIGTLVAFTSMQNRLVSPVAQLLGVALGLSGSLAVFARIFESLDLPVDIAPGKRGLDDPRGNVELRDVWFRYGDDWTLRGVDLTIPAGTHVAVAGETGAGKTTLAYLVARLYEAEKGSVTIDGVDVRELSFEALTGTVGLVAQETFLLHASIRENLRFARVGGDPISDGEIEEAARAARIHDLIASLPDGYDTVVGERGHRFSGGERQRIAIARTLLRDPRVLILDEATSALDTRTERLVREALVELAKGRTTITIAHRDATLRDADRIVWLERGTLRDLGERI